ncbi:MAG TPA: RluA family pseudouridine synthase [Anaerolineaceae bacterium]|nr:RluA family pseudouridine synthase [Anaerolineaceae bacterium]HPD62965.1 RluA family pseudouridine synthase [Anaerolineaceae bacterium]HRS73948.1 RluA family pseudouridine synthase [Anaerolineaceae bacterium]HRT91824.1 RluA family pseudouridine synthase [Anaerolineaceae bacterium]HUM63130.1 RluA family pseudouridine synthase [Anaerolineaceae bacterium]
MSSQRCQFIVQSGDENRLDKFLARQLPGQSRSRLQAIIKDGGVTVNETVATKSGLALLTGDKVSICIPEVVPVNLEPESIPLDIVFENEHLVIINKPAGMVVHPAPGHASGTLVHAALGNFGDLQGIGGEVRPGIVHRLDKDTSGLIIVAKNGKAHRWLQEQFRLRKVKKTYLALVDGKPPTPSGRVEAAIARDAAHRKQMTVVSDGRGRAAITEFHTVKQFNQHTLVEAHPLTGRTHQIRLHMAFLGCPIVGDLVYGRKKPSLDLERHFLHAYQISIILPGESEARTFQAELPADLQTILDQLI